MELLLKYRRPIIVCLHISLAISSNYLAFWLRFDGDIPSLEASLFFQMLPWLIVIRGLMFIPFRMYEGLWRYTGLWDLRNITLGVVSSSVIFYILTHWIFGLTAYSRSIYLIDTALLTIFLAGIRLIRRIHRELGKVDRAKRVLIYGAGDAGELTVLNMKNQDAHDYGPIGFIDDNPGKVGRSIHGVRVLGTQSDLPKIIQSTEPDEILIAIPSLDPVHIRSIVKALEPFKLPIKTLPSLHEMLNGRATFNQIRDLSMEDLLMRAPLGLDPEPIRHLITGKCVLVTGAGGSIGSELCRQIAKLHPEALILFERYENGLYTIMNDLTDAHSSDVHVYPFIGDITDEQRLNIVMAQQRPDIIFHAAAHKHVPLMEINPCEAVKNNIIGTLRVIEAADRHHAERFIMISSDKAVNPSSVMGATKRVKEFLVHGMSQRSRTAYIAVRFGNVLGSNGSVVPRFLEQIKARKPVTVTHPEVRRFFMSIPEAVCLILHAGAIGKGGEIYVLDMGEQIKVLDLARNLIRLSGFVPDKEIPIEFIGLRPGEKLYEELVGTDETVEPSSLKQVNRIKSGTAPDFDILMLQIKNLEQAALQGDSSAVLKGLCNIIPNFAPMEIASQIPLIRDSQTPSKSIGQTFS